MILVKTIIQIPQTNIITRIDIFVVINQINKHEARTYNHCTYTQNYYKKMCFFFFTEYRNEWKWNKFQRQQNRKKRLLQEKF